MPLSAFIGGPMADSVTLGPLAINDRFWEAVCPAPERHTVTSRDAPSTRVVGKSADHHSIW
ncbi:hypothetical protein BD779DRAFT_1515427 [Infundibulicybe gibba]|nr:hypothetical protein BD779DRAFT_1515427 [Infundibulicybe gibba]